MPMHELLILHWRLVKPRGGRPTLGWLHCATT